MFRVSAPGSLMVLGEYGVLYGKSALVGAIDQRLTVTFMPRTDQTIRLVSALGEYQTTVSALAPVVPFQFVLAALHHLQPVLREGFDLIIESGFAATLGFASSAAVTVATLAAVREALLCPVSSTSLIQEARAVIRAVQGGGSGADVAACVLGGLVAYRADPLSTEVFTSDVPLSVIYSGYKTPTPVVMAGVKARFSAYPTLFRHLIDAIGETAEVGIAALRRQDLVALGEAMTMQQGLMETLGVNSPALAEGIAALRRSPGIQGAKISGSGLGDCVIGLGESTASTHAVAFSSEGMRHEKI